MPDLTCYDFAGNPVPCSSEEIGEQYYTAVQSGNPDELIEWYNFHLSPFLEGADLDEDFGSDPELFNQWMGSYGQYYAPMQFDQADFDRINRESSLQKEQLQLRFMESQPGAELEEGKRGFASTGGTGQIASSIMDDYAANYQSITSSHGQQLSDLYGDFGQNFLMTTTAVAGLGGFLDPILSADDWGAEGAFSYIGDDQEDQAYDTLGQCLEACYEETGDYLQCSQSCLD